MPTYVYECSSCHQQFEIVQRITENALDTCLCGSKGTFKRLIQPIAVMFKGSGFHINDYAASTNGPAKEEKADKVEKSSEAPASSEAASSDSSKPAETTSESKPAPATPAAPTSSDKSD